jgi:hypothetical protein
MMRLRYSVTIQEFGHPGLRERIIGGLTLAAAWRLVRRQARRGFKLHGGTIAYANWGGRGGIFPSRYRSAVIRLDHGLCDARQPSHGRSVR